MEFVILGLPVEGERSDINGTTYALEPTFAIASITPFYSVVTLQQAVIASRTGILAQTPCRSQPAADGAGISSVAL